jgi:hypothetical protein
MPPAIGHGIQAQMPRSSAGPGINDERGMGALHPASVFGHQPFGRFELDPDRPLASAAPSPLSAISAKFAQSAQIRAIETTGGHCIARPYPSLGQAVDPSTRSSVRPDHHPECHLTTYPAMHFPPSPRILELSCTEWDRTEGNGMETTCHGMEWHGME